MRKLTALMVVATGLLVGSTSAWPGARTKKPPPLAKLVKGRILLAKKIQFASASVRPRSLLILQAVAGLAHKHRRLILRVEVHTDARGLASRNLRSTQARANEVKRLLLKMGVNAKRIQAIGRGEARPIAPNRTAAGRAKNRRVEFSLVRRRARPRP